MVTCNRVQHPDCWTPCLPVTISPVGTSIFILAPYAKDVKPRIFLLPRTLYVHTLDKSHIPTRVRDAGQESGGLSQNRTVTIAYRESSPRQTQRRLCGVTIQTSCFDSGTSPTRSVGVSEVYVYRHIRQMGECPSMRFSLLRSISIGPGNRSIFAPRKPMQNVHPCAFRFRVRSLLVQKIVRFWGNLVRIRRIDSPTIAY